MWSPREKRLQKNLCTLRGGCSAAGVTRSGHTQGLGDQSAGLPTLTAQQMQETRASPRRHKGVWARWRGLPALQQRGVGSIHIVRSMGSVHTFPWSASILSRGSSSPVSQESITDCMKDGAASEQLGAGCAALH